ncbi:MAG: carboxymuconolactone decarboxylase family protein [Acidimicrobiia bacterium]
MGHYHDVSMSATETTKGLREFIPDTYEGFHDTHRAAFTDGALSPAVKEMMAVAIAVSDRCEGCIASHARGAARHGATDEQFAEMISVAILMNGGPGTVYAPKAWVAFQEFKERYA